MTLGIGIDVVDVQRFRKVLQRREKISSRLFTDNELSYCHTVVDPAERLAVRFAAKEAVMKALGVGLGSVRFREIEVTKDPSGRPSLVLHGAAAQLAADTGVRQWHISLSHTSSVAEAFVIAE
ncbi:MAG: holo-ACP synthase [Acidimicrobiaceae bacterium]|jgi:holo-[acyl-carrier protein] synthase|nr:holo-ACP synthase [Acidimicrobiaceae bacterium]|tara:strand:- start:159 stop:527 length:369 start_codon:yes stop_codon:yes gene_type:complete